MWITPFYPSPGHDHGYDVADYCGVDPQLGTLEDFDRVLQRAHALDMGVLIDVVPNHTSVDHPWFRAARRSRDDAYRDYYLWRDPAPDGGPPNNWRSVFGGGAWTLDAQTKQYYLHLFLPEQPDLNWRHPAVVEEFDAVLRFWLARGVDGFRIDVARALVKHPDLPDNPPAASRSGGRRATVAGDWASLEHVHDIDQAENVDIYRRWRKAADSFDAALLGEVYLLQPERLQRHVADDVLHLTFWFQPLHVEWNAAAIRGVLEDGTRLPVGRVAWVQGSHDRRRAASRYGAGEVGKARQLVMAVLQMGLAGLPFIYQGEELGLVDGALLPEEIQDPLARHEQDISGGRDAARTPMPWSIHEANRGFSSATPWLPLRGRVDSDTEQAQRDAEGSMFQRYRELIAVRRRLALGHTPVAWLDLPGETIGYRRAETVVIANVGAAEQAVALGGSGWRLAYATGGVRLAGEGALVPPTGAGIFTREEDTAPATGPSR